MSLSPLKRDTHYSSLESLSLPRRQRVFDTQLVPAGDALPIWNSLPLDSKLPVVPSPKGSYTLYTTRVGQPMYIHKQHYDFDLNNSLYAKPGEYDSLHDPFLKGYFYKPRTKRLLVNNDLITKDGKVKCDIKEFNQYRSYLRYRSVTELSLQRSGDRVEESWLPGPARAVKTTANVRTKPNSLDFSRTSSQKDDTSHHQIDPYGRDVSLVQRMRMREETLLKRMTEKERERVREHKQRIKESWQSRKQRQERILQHEDEIDKKVKEERARQVLVREKTLARRRDRVIAKFGHSKGGASKGKHANYGNKGKADKHKEGSGDEEQESPQESPRGQERDYASDNA